MKGVTNKSGSKLTETRVYERSDQTNLHYSQISTILEANPHPCHQGPVAPMPFDAHQPDYRHPFVSRPCQ